MENNVELHSAYDQYQKYENLPKLLCRYSFSEKMAIATIHSSKAILFGSKLKKDPRQAGVFPWCIETFVMLSMEAKEYSDNDFRGANEKKFYKICDAIWNATPQRLEEITDGLAFADTFMAVTGLTQFVAQENLWIRRYRYWKIFNNNDSPAFLKDTFNKKFGTDYMDFLLLGYMLQVFFVAQATKGAGAIPQGALHYLLFCRFPEAAKNLLVSREKYKELQQSFARNSNNPYDYIYSLRPSYQFAFVLEEDKIYFPLPHLLNENVTSALYYRITDGNDKLRDQIGKVVLETYMLNIISESHAYHEVFPEQHYLDNGSNSRSPDVLARQGNDVLFVDSKSTVPSIGIRLLSSDAYAKNIEIVADNIRKLYNHMTKFSKYNPFEGEVSESLDFCWGIVTVLEDSYIRRHCYFEKACELLKIAKGSDKWNWLIRHIKVLSFYEIERLSFSGCSLIDALKATSTDDLFNPTFIGFPVGGSSFRNSDFLSFQESLEQRAKELAEEMRNAGVLG